MTDKDIGYFEGRQQEKKRLKKAPRKEKDAKLKEIGEVIENSDRLRDIRTDDSRALSVLLEEPQVYIENLLKIQTKAGEIEPFMFNNAQQRIYDEYMTQMEEGKPVRIIILKARQLGFTTWSSAMMFHSCVTRANTNAMLVTHKNDASRTVLAKHKMFLENLPNGFKPQVKKSNAIEMEFNNPSVIPKEQKKMPGLNSLISIESAVNKEVARSKTIRFLHLSELAFWPYPAETMASALQAVPALPGTVVIIESTANGVGDVFHQEWLRAERGESGFTPMFFPWYEEPEYAMPVPANFRISDEEQELKNLYRLTDEQLVWRRWCIRANCNGSEDIFRQEYPGNPNEAFLTSGRPVFDIKALEKAYEQAEPPLYCGRLTDSGAGIQFVTNWNGVLRVWEEPQEGRSYIIGVDVAEGLEKGDYSVAEVLDHQTGNFVAEWHGHCNPDIFAGEIVKLARWYKMAWVIPEVNNHGLTTITAMRKDWHYNRIYRRRSSSDDTEERAVGKYGFQTNRKTKPELIDNLAAFIRDRWQGFKNREFIDEAMSYCYDDKGLTNAQIGCYDDRVMAAALAVWGLKERSPEYLSIEYIDATIDDMYGKTDKYTGY